MKKALATALLLFISFFTSYAMAGEIKPYTQAQFDTLTKTGHPVLLAIHADWCPICKAQRGVLDTLMKDPAYKNVTTLVIDFDTEKNLVRQYKAVMQSTLIAYKGTKEVGRAVGITADSDIQSLVDKTLE